jgi:hypothetical protein
MKYYHVKTGAVVTKHPQREIYTNILGYSLPSEIVENSNEWKVYNEITEDVRFLNYIPCLSIKDIGLACIKTNTKVDLSNVQTELIKLVQEKLNK